MSRDGKEEWERAVELCDEILEQLPDLPERAASFVESVEAKVTDMREWIEKNEKVTDKQFEALRNMKDGADRWAN